MSNRGQGLDGLCVRYEGVEIPGANVDDWISRDLVAYKPGEGWDVVT